MAAGPCRIGTAPVKTPPEFRHAPTPNLPTLSLALDATDPEFRTDTLTQVPDVIGSSPVKAARNGLLTKAIDPK